MRLLTTINAAQLPDGTRAAVVGALPDEASPEVAEGFRRRAVVNAGGTCPCGATLAMPNRAQRRSARRRGVPLTARAVHERDCPAIDSNLARLVEEAGR